MLVVMAIAMAMAMLEILMIVAPDENLARPPLPNASWCCASHTPADCSTCSGYGQGGGGHQSVRVACHRVLSSTLFRQIGKA
mmetsp:Transcript_82823/g.115041  ORF Transcript_82823/g.115041 Transcript_82823/m.115041 type:complete len:82 (+) Transcript_82823:422-667(+)